MPRPISYAVFCLKKKKSRKLPDRLEHDHVAHLRAAHFSVCERYPLLLAREVFFFFNDTPTTEIYTLSLPTLFRSPFKALMFLTLMRPSLVLFLVLWLKLVKDF